MLNHAARVQHLYHLKVLSIVLSFAIILALLPFEITGILGVPPSSSSARLPKSS